MSDSIALPTNIETPINQTINQKPTWEKWLGLVVLSLGLAIIIIDTTLLNVSLSTIIKDLNTDLKSLQWVITAYALVLAALTITGGRLGDLFGRKKMFMLGAVIFAIGSFLASISTNMPMLLWGESIIEGIGAALMMPATASLVVANFTGKDRAMAFGIWGAVAGASSAIGPLLGGYLTSHYSWRWGFRINVFVAALVIIGCLLFISESKDERKPKLDIGGVLLSAIGLFALVFGIIESTTYGWWKAKEAFVIFGQTLNFGGLSIVPISLLVSAIFLGFFVWDEIKNEREGKSPLVSMSMFKNRQFTSGVLTISILSLGMTGMVFALPVFLQSVRHLDAFNTGLALLPMSAAILVVAPLVGFLTKKYEPKYFISAGLFIDIIAALILRQTINADVTVTQLIFGLSLYGIGMAMVFAPISNIILSAVPVNMSGEASGVNNTLRQVGGSLGAAIIGAAVLASITGHLSNGIQHSPIIPEDFKSQIVKQISDPKSDIEFSQAALLPSGTPPIVIEEMKKLTIEASAQATKDAYLYSALFAFIGFVISLFIPSTHITEEEKKSQKALPKSRFIFAGLAMLIATLITAAILKSSADKVIASGLQPQVNADNIRQLFAPNNNSQNPLVATPTPLPTLTPTPSPAQASTTTISEPQSKIFTDDKKTFEIILTTEWQMSVTSDGSVSLKNPSNQIANIQVYQTTETLSEVQSELSGSSSVSLVTKTTFKGYPALSFTANGQKSIAVITNGKIYYIFGSNLINENDFRFINN